MKYLNSNSLPWNPAVAQMPIGRAVLVMKGDGSIPFMVMREDDELALVFLGNDSDPTELYVMLSEIACWLDVCTQIDNERPTSD